MTLQLLHGTSTLTYLFFPAEDEAAAARIYRCKEWPQVLRIQPRQLPHRRQTDKFGVQSSSAQKKGLLGRVKEKAKINDKGKGRELDVDLLPSTPNYDVFPITPILARPASAIPVDVPSSRVLTDRSTSLSSVETDHISSLVPSSQSSLTASTQPTLHWADSSSSATANASHTTMVPDSTSSELPDPLTVSIGSTLRRGTTPFLKLKDHSVIWSHTLDTLLKFDIDRETSHILPNPLKLVVMQRVIPDDPDGSPQNPRLGAVYLNLAEYVGKGSVERKYLLKESKTNSVLKVINSYFFILNPY